jgi:hypothetical protein
MKVLLRKLALFITPLIVLMFFVDWFMSYKLKNSREGEFSVWNDIYNGRVNSDVVIYGSSRAMVHLDPKIINDSLDVSTYNLGINGHNFWLQYYRHKELLEHNVKPGFIIHSVDIFTLAKRKDLFNMEQFLPYMLYNMDLHHWLESYEGYSWYDYNIPVIRYYGQFKTIGRVLKATFTGETMADSGRFLGFSAQHLKWNDDLAKAKRKIPNFIASVDPQTVKLFDTYLRECIEANIPVVLVYSPEYIEGQDFVKNRSEIMNIFAVFSAKYNIPFIDYSHDSISYNKEYFYNASHLNATGAQVFTSKLIHDIKKDDRIVHMVYSAVNRNTHQAIIDKTKF